jgi:Protein of unknown function (DUF4089)
MKDASTTLGPFVGLAIEPANRSKVDANFAQLAAAAELIMAFELPAAIEPATIYISVPADE